MNHRFSGEICQVGRAIRLPEFASGEAGAASFAQPLAGESATPPLSNCLRSADTSSPWQKSFKSETAGEIACATKLHQRFARTVGQAFSLPRLLPRAASRRIFLKCGLGAGVAGALIPSISGRTLHVPCYKAIFDERFEDPRVFAARAMDRGIRATAIRGDITRLFFDDLDLRWKQGPIRLAGYTTPASLFCLDLLARDRGMRVSHCVMNPNVKLALGLLDAAAPPGTTAAPLPSGDSSRLVFWMIGPKVPGGQDQAAGV